MISVRPGSATSCDLSQGHWRLVVVQAAAGGRGGLALALRYPSAMPLLFDPSGRPMAVAEFQQYVLAIASIEIADNAEDLRKVAEVALERGAHEADLERVTEAMSLFKNLPRLREETFQSCLKEARGIVDGYWAIVDWLRNATRTRAELKIADAQLVLEP